MEKQGAFFGHILCTIILFASALSLHGGADAIAGERRPPLQPFQFAVGVPRFEQAECPCDVPEEAQGRVRCGYLIVPEDRNAMVGRTIRVAVAIVRSTNASPCSDPVVYLEGGPGGGTLSDLKTWLNSPFLRERDLILFDQRGSGFSEPDLWCPELDDAVSEVETSGISSLDAQMRISAAARASAERLRQEGVNLACYNTAAIAADVEDLRHALGHKTWNLYGISYGTRVALTVLRDFPDGVRCVVLDSCVPLEVKEYEEAPANLARSLRRLFDICSMDKACRRAFPNLERSFQALVGSLDARPLQLNISSAEGRDPRVVRFDGQDFVQTLFQQLYDEQIVPYLPLFITRTASGDIEPLRRIVESDEEGDGDGLYYCVECHDEAPFNSSRDAETRTSAFRELRGYNPFRYDIELCRSFGIPSASPNESQPVQSDVPALILAGGFDPITPPAWGRKVAAQLRNALYFEFPNAGHGVTTNPGCPLEIAVSFIHDPKHRPDTWCIVESAPLIFVTSRDNPDSPYGIAAPEGSTAHCIERGLLFLLEKTDGSRANIRHQ